MLTLVMMLVCVMEGKMAWVVEGLDGGCVAGFPKICGELWEDLPNSLPFFSHSFSQPSLSFSALMGLYFTSPETFRSNFKKKTLSKNVNLDGKKAAL